MFTVAYTDSYVASRSVASASLSVLIVVFMALYKFAFNLLKLYLGTATTKKQYYKFALSVACMSL